MKLITDIKDDRCLRCCICKHYLSVKPVLMNIENGENTCGRCKSLTVSYNRNRWYESLAQQFFFPCIYDVDGCTVKTAFNDVLSHETYCNYRIVSCHCSWTGKPSALRMHYEKQHKELMINEGSTLAIKNDFTRFLYTTKIFQFLCTRNSDNCSIEVVGVTNFDVDSNALFTYKLVDQNLDFKTELNKILELPLTNKPSTFTLGCEFDSSILKQIACVHCGLQVTPPVLQCKKEHVACMECMGYSFDYCNVCDNQASFRCNRELEYIAAVAIFSCRWKCGSEFDAYEIRKHEQACEKRPYECFHGWKGCFSELAIHDEELYPDGVETHSCSLVYNKDEIVFFPQDIFLNAHFVIHYTNFDVSFEYRYGYPTVSVGFVDKYAIGWFDFHAELIHTEDANFPFNKTYELRDINTVHNHSLDVPEDDILKFGEDRPFKIILRVTLLNEEARKAKTDSFYNQFENYKRYFYE